MSHNSRKTGVSKGSYVDEALFGAKNGKKTTFANNGVAVISNSELKDIREKTEKGQKSDAIVISKGELERMRGTTKIQTKE